MNRRALLAGASALTASRALAQPMPLIGPVGGRQSGGGPLWSVSTGPPGTTLDLSFMNPGTLDPLITFTRASVATYFDATGTMQTAAINAPRWDYDPVTHVLRGMLIESQRNNLLLNSAAPATQSVVITAQPYTLSFYGTGQITLSGVSTAGPLNGTGAFPQRVALTFTPTAGTLTCTITGSVVNAQLEAGQFVTSYIPTGGALVTRGAENAVASSATLFSGTGGKSVAIDGMAMQNPASGSNTNWVSVNDGTINNQMSFVSPASSPNLRTVITVGGVSKINASDTTTGARPTLFKAAIANDVVWNSAVNGAMTSASGGASVQLGSLTQIQIGVGGTVPIDGYVRRVRYWSRALASSELQSVTT